MADQYFGYFKSSLAVLSERLGVKRDDTCEHQAGSDSKMTARCFFELFKADKGLLHSCMGEIYGINNLVEPSHQPNYQKANKFERKAEGSLGSITQASSKY